MSDEGGANSGYLNERSITGATGGKTKAAKDAARKEAHERGVATRAANMRKKALPEEGSDGIDVRAPRCTPRNNIP